MRRALIALAAVAVVAAVVIGLSQAGGTTEAPRSATPVVENPGEVLGGGKSAFDKQLAAHRGTPVVVNKWASWCGPCRFEFPFFQRLARRYEGKVAFVGLNAGDNRADATAFLEKFPVPFDSIEDPAEKISRAIGAARNYPITIYYDARGEREYIHQGGYPSEAELVEDIERYAL